MGLVTGLRSRFRRHTAWVAGLVLVTACTRDGPDAVGEGAASAGTAIVPARAIADAATADIPDARRGELLSLACRACHTLAADEPGSIGPNLHGVFGRPAASRGDFAYSPALQASGVVWTDELLDAWIAAPADVVAGTSMAFSGYQSAADRRAVIAYLREATADGR